ncbi:hypothetical protein [Variovorax terrae]|uniref:Uncharacterized protein n=1 Tax=Variovorax terrae TaxID=2923278 RepID=A0A9X2AQH6_9BURK|nr:hypothetical protein [Variovorax terrae]MCJ0763191.1 hypothetical protein [Variovorax terrae]
MLGELTEQLQARADPQAPVTEARVESAASIISANKAEDFVRLVVAVFFLLAGVAQASPTASDYQACHARGALGLRHCLDRSPGTDLPVCWDNARAAVQRCYADVRNEYDPGYRAEKRAAEMRAREQHERK